MSDYLVYLNSGICVRVRNAKIDIDCEPNIIVFYDSSGEIKAVYMDNAVSYIIMDDEDT